MGSACVLELLDANATGPHAQEALSLLYPVNRTRQLNPLILLPFRLQQQRFREQF